MNLRTRKILSFGVWALAAFASLFLWLRHDESRAEIKGLVDAKVHQLSVSDMAVVEQIMVQPGQHVREGTPLVVMGRQDLAAQLDIAKAQLLEMTAAMEAESQAYLNELGKERIELQSRQAQATAQHSNAQAVTASQKAELYTLGQQLKRLSIAERAGVAALESLAQLRTRQARLSRASRHSPKAITGFKLLTQRLTEALKRLDKDQSAIRLGPFKARLKTQTQVVNGLLEKIKRRTIKAPVAGQITRLLATRGHSVVAGSPVIELVETRSRRATAYVPEMQFRQLRVGQIIGLKAAGRTQNGGSLTGVVSNVGGTIVQIPQRLWRHPRVPEYGRAVHVKLDDNQLLPGEVIAGTLVSAQPQKMAVSAAQSNKTPSDLASKKTESVAPRKNAASVQVRHIAQSKPAVRPLPVPDALRAKTRMEISGAVYLTDLKQTLVISDDTGIEGSTDGSPWVFWINEDDTLSTDPTVISGLKTISDLEAVTEGPDGRLYFLCSQSQSKRGKRPKKRQCFFCTKRDGRRLSVVGSVSLFSLLKKALGQDQWRRLGLSDELDIEGMAWWKDGLLFGLKSPLAESRKAQILYLKGIDAVFQTEAELNPSPLDLSVLTTVELPTGPDQRAGGISELMVQGDRLYMLSTVLDGADASAAWYLDLAHLERTPVQWASWPNLKAEGLAKAPQNKIRIFFDRGSDTPMMTLMDLPD
ncbi:MAG: hypothetical protein CMH52_13690 [Myxococcales bacterium]|nr:hypothetical protein [Myxococcales bacterium]